MQGVVGWDDSWSWRFSYKGVYSIWSSYGSLLLAVLGEREVKCQVGPSACESVEELGPLKSVGVITDPARVICALYGVSN